MAFPTSSMTYLPPRQPVWGMGDMIAHGSYTQYKPWMKIGYNPDISTTEEGLWNVGGAFNLLGSATALEVVSNDNTNDKAGGTGALTVTIYYLHEDFSEHSEVKTMNGTAAVALTDTAVAYVNGFRVTSAGTGGAAAGTILLRKASAGVTISSIAPGESRARRMVYTVPEGKEVYIESMNVGSGGATADKSYLRFRLKANYSDQTWTTSTVYYTFAEASANNNSTLVHFPVPLRFPAGITMYVVAAGSSGTTSAAANCALRGYIETE